ncbi:MAG: methionyl-tRNA formyltransferase [Lutibacter sp.]|uniref:methionyl-tRNA formyltransferase n=1 Tax=Lutibacter sp. TaxID=1925666 RepID=UPI00299F0E42|nr:methionyl-tRNA formyltransferase [Lutibacter sp.]MDX1827911.1 methionyl-tRNA formyltransferase [Lutibacter sp.]
MRELRIVFMGTPDFAVGSLDALVKANFNIVAVITAPDKPAGRGKKLNQSAVKKYALEHDLKLLQPTNLKNENFLKELEQLNANLQIVVAFRMLPKVIWQMPKFGTFNLHASLLPNYRGAAPINWAIINGETKTGVTTFFIDEKIDTGSIILQEEVAINENTNVGELHDILMDIGSKLVVKTTQLIAEDNIKTLPQIEKDSKSAPKIYTETCKINWNKPLNEIYNLIRGLNPYPAAWSLLLNENEEIKVKIFDVEKELINHTYNIGKVISTKNEIKIATANGFLKVNSLQLAGKRKMDAKSLLNGYSFSSNAKML